MAETHRERCERQLAEARRELNRRIVEFRRDMRASAERYPLLAASERAREAAEIAAHPDLAYMDAQMDGFYD